MKNQEKPDPLHFTILNFLYPLKKNSNTTLRMLINLNLGDTGFAYNYLCILYFVQAMGFDLGCEFIIEFKNDKIIIDNTKLNAKGIQSPISFLIGLGQKKYCWPKIKPIKTELKTILCQIKSILTKRIPPTFSSAPDILVPEDMRLLMYVHYFKKECKYKVDDIKKLLRDKKFRYTEEDIDYAVEILNKNRLLT